MTAMNLVTFAADHSGYWGVTCGDGGVIALSDAFPQWPGLREVIAAGAIDTVLDAAQGRAATHASGTYVLEPPVRNPGKILCVGVNFPDRNAEYRDGGTAGQNMSLFPRFPGSFTGHGQPLIRPPESEQLDYEGEIAVVIGTGGRRIPEDRALEHIAALTLCNEGTIRDWTRHAKFNVTQGKNWQNSGAMGPWLVPYRTPSQLLDIGLRTRVNGAVRQEDRTGRMLYPIARQIAYISTFTALEPGDIIVTGTPSGAGARLEPPVWLKPGDVVEVEADGIGVLRNGVADE